MAKKSQSWWRGFTKKECTRLSKTRKYRAECKIEQKKAAYWLPKKTEYQKMASEPAKPKRRWLEARDVVNKELAIVGPISAQSEEEEKEEAEASFDEEAEEVSFDEEAEEDAFEDAMEGADKAAFDEDAEEDV